MSFQDKVDKTFGPTLYNNYNKAISEVIGSKLNVKNDIVLQKENIEEEKSIE